MQKRPPLGDSWYESEQSTRTGMIVELQRIKQRTRVRPWRVLALAAFVTAAVTYRFATKPKHYEANVVLAVNEGSMASRSGIPFDQLQEYVNQVLMPDNRLIELVERLDLHRLRTKLGDQYALEELRGQTEVEIWKNSFTYYHESESNALKSARVGLTVGDADADLAFEVARGLATIIVEEHDKRLAKAAAQLTAEVQLARDELTKQAEDLTAEITLKQTALVNAKLAGKTGLAAALVVDTAALAEREKQIKDQLSQIAASPEVVADRAAAAGLDITIDVVEERRPIKHEQSELVLAMIIVVIGTGAFVGSALMLGAFDSRVHDTDDVARLGLPVLGHVPGFPGDDVGSLDARGAKRARVPSFLRWRS